MPPSSSVNEQLGRVRPIPDLSNCSPPVQISSPPERAVAWKVPVNDAVTYSIHVAEPLCDPTNLALMDSGRGSDRRLIAWDSNVPLVWRDAFRSYFAYHDVSVTFVTIDGGESCKNLGTAISLLSTFQRHELDRSREPLIVVGGGAVLDVVGFAASIYRWGVPTIRVPTTLLAYVDASVGIKNGVNFGPGKNLLGTFTPPSRVLLDCGFFSSLSEANWTSGFGEILKLGLGCDKIIFEMLEQGAGSFQRTRMQDDDGRALLHRSIDVMLQELSGNIYEHELSRNVDLGHTFSQAFEMGESAMSHGHAVAVDLLMSAAIAVGRGMMPQGDLDRLITLTRNLGLPLAPRKPDARATWASLVERKQHRSERQRTPIPTEIGHCEFVDDLTSSDVETALNWVAAINGERPLGSGSTEMNSDSATSGKRLLQPKDGTPTPSPKIGIP
jgi:3-dehydroquinate synthetase